MANWRDNANLLEEDDNGYLRDTRDFFIVYTDGACTGNHGYGDRYSGYGIYFGSGRSISQRCHTTDSRVNTNNYAELKAILIALRHAYKYDRYPIQVRSDSEWCVNTLTGEYNTRMHGELFSEIRGLEEDMNVEYVHVRRSREFGNREANQLAQDAAEMHRNLNN